LAAVYSLDDYLLMMEDRGRMDAYAKAIAEVVTPSSVVLDLGAGTGPMTFLALQAGAKHVFAVETNEAIEAAKLVARRMGWSSRITFLRQDARKIQLPEQVDVLVADVRGTLPLFTGGFDLVADVAKAWLKPGGHLIPLRDQIFLAAVEAPDDHERLAVWRDWRGIDYSPLRRIVAGRFGRNRFLPGQLLTEKVGFAPMHYGHPIPLPLVCEGERKVLRDGTVHGLVAWFAAILSETVSYSSGPGDEAVVYKQAYLPLLEPRAVARDQIIRIRAIARQVDGLPMWQWEFSSLDSAGQSAFFEKRSSLDGLFLQQP